MLIFYILGSSSIYIFIFFLITALWNSWKCDVIHQIKKSWPNVYSNLSHNCVSSKTDYFILNQNWMLKTTVLSAILGIKWSGNNTHLIN